MGNVNIKFTGDDADLRSKFKASQKALDDLEKTMLKLNTIKLQNAEVKAKLTVDTSDFKRKQEELKTSMLSMRESKMKIGLDTTKAKSDMTEFQQFTNSMLGKITIGNLAAGGILAGLGLIQQSIQSIANGLKDSLNVMAQYEVSMRGLQSVSKSYGQSADLATEAAKALASDGLIPLNAATTTLKNLISAGYSVDEAFKLANAMKDIGAFNNVVGDLGQAMMDSSKGIKTGSMELIENVGLTERLSAVMKRAGVDISQGIDITNNAAQAQALFNSVMEQGAKSSGNASEYMKTYAGNVAVSATAFKELQKEMGELLKGPSGEVMKFFTSGTKELTIIIKKATEERNQVAKAQNLMNPKTQLYFMGLDELKTSIEALQKEFDKNAQAFMSGGWQKGDVFQTATPEQMKYWQTQIDVLQHANKVLTERQAKEDKKTNDKADKKEDKKTDNKKEVETLSNDFSDNTLKYLNNGLREIARLSGKEFAEVANQYIKRPDEISDETMTGGYASYIDKLGSTQQYFTPEEIQEAVKNGIMEGLDLKRDLFTNEDITPSNTSGIDYGQHYGKATEDVTMEGINAYKEALNLTDEEIKALADNADDLAKQIRSAQSDIANSISEIGEILGNDFIKALGSVANDILKIQDSVKQAQSTNAIESIAGMFGIAGAAVSIGMTIANALNPASDKQIKAAENMNDAANEIKKAFQDKTVQQMYLEEAPRLSAEVERLKGEKDKANQNVKNTAEMARSQFWINPLANKAYDDAKKYEKSVENALQATVDTLNSLKPEILQALSITLQDFATSVRSAFDASNLDEFYSQFKTNLAKTIKDALITAFLQSTAFKEMLTGLSDSIFNDLKAVDFDVSKLTPEQTAKYQEEIEKIATAGGAFFEILQPILKSLGIAAENTTDSLNAAANAINSIPQGVKVDMYRYRNSSVTEKNRERISDPGFTPKDFEAPQGFRDAMSNADNNTAINVYIGYEKIEGLVKRVQVKENKNMWGA